MTSAFGLKFSEDVSEKCYCVKRNSSEESLDFRHGEVIKDFIGHMMPYKGRVSLWGRLRKL